MSTELEFRTRLEVLSTDKVSDMMAAAWAIDRISTLEAELQGRLCMTHCGICGESAGSSEALANKRIAELEKQRDAWISVEDRLPEQTQRVIAYANDIVSANVLELLYWEGVGRFATVDYEDFPPIVTHWMPLPGPPE